MSISKTFYNEKYCLIKSQHTFNFELDFLKSVRENTQNSQTLKQICIEPS